MKINKYKLKTKSSALTTIIVRDINCVLTKNEQ